MGTVRGESLSVIYGETMKKFLKVFRETNYKLLRI